MDLVWWITVVDVPALAGLLALIWRTRREHRDEVDALELRLEGRFDQMRDAFAAFRLDVATGYASEGDVGALESRLVAHLLRIEAKLDSTALKAEAAMARVEG